MYFEYQTKVSSIQMIIFHGGSHFVITIWIFLQYSNEWHTIIGTLDWYSDDKYKMAERNTRHLVWNSEGKKQNVLFARHWKLCFQMNPVIGYPSGTIPTVNAFRNIILWGHTRTTTWFDWQLHPNHLQISKGFVVLGSDVTMQPNGKNWAIKKE